MSGGESRSNLEFSNNDISTIWLDLIKIKCQLELGESDELNESFIWFGDVYKTLYKKFLYEDIDCEDMINRYEFLKSMAQGISDPENCMLSEYSKLQADRAKYIEKNNGDDCALTQFDELYTHRELIISE